MNRIISRGLLFGFPTAMLLTMGSITMAATGSQMKACKNAVLEQHKFHDLPMAAVSVYPGKKENHAHFTVRWEGRKADGNCKVSGSSYVKKVKIKNFHDGRSGDSDGGSWSDSNDLDGFYFDRHTGKWRDPEGRTCNTCTVENGFPDRSHHYYQDDRPKNKYEAHMQKELRNSLSADDIRALNSL